MESELPSSPEPGHPKPATFEGKLQLSNFSFSAPAAPLPGPAAAALLPRRSGRNVPPPPRQAKRKAPSPCPSPCPSPPSLSPSQQRVAVAASAGKKRIKTADPAEYAHLSLLPDALLPDLLVLFVGLNPGVETARTGHAYAHPTNLFWRLLHRAGVTPRQCRPDEDADMPRLFSLGLTNIVARPSRCGAELSRREMDEGVAVLEAKVRLCRPEVVCLVGKGIWDSVERVWKGRGRGRGGERGKGRSRGRGGGITEGEGGKKGRGRGFEYGWQDQMGRIGSAEKAPAVSGPQRGKRPELGKKPELGQGQEGQEWQEGQEEQKGQEEQEGQEEDGGPPWEGARLFVATSTSGLAAGLSPAEKEAIWGELGAWVQSRRAERSAAGEGIVSE